MMVVIADSQSVKTVGAGRPTGFNADKQAEGRKRHIVVDPLGLPIECHVIAADVHTHSRSE